MSIPRLLVAGTSSGVGKTTVVVALARALQRRGLKVVTFKCGPDYLDPTYHARATGRASHNLDGWMMGREAVAATFERASAGADIAILEGVMGLFDSASATTEAGSAAEIAKWLGAPALVVLDASGMARTIAALGLGLRDFDQELRVAGLFANRVGSRGHLKILESACKSPPVLGGLPKQPELSFPERHLGLRTADSSALPEEIIDRWAALLEEWVDVGALLSLAREAGPLPPTGEIRRPRTGTRCRIGIAHDSAFHFYYEDNLARLEDLGAELVRFSPIDDASLPRVDGLYFGGGYPEVHAEALARNQSMRDAVRAFTGPIYAECGGLMYLAQAIRTLDGNTHPMVGLVRGTAIMHERLQALGYVEVELQRRTFLGGAGVRLRGHQFRYSQLEGAQSEDLAYTIRRRRGDSTEREGYGGDRLLASYVHVHFASNPSCAEAWVAACAEHTRP
jgi:cobyrinic acid a,c-diamide synthase